MTWILSRFRAGDLVEVRSKEEILATLDEHGTFDGMPFMPEMLDFCGQRVRVGAVAHKTCETARRTWTGRRLEATVHLAGLSCDGSAHGGCQAACNLFWKDVWLKPEDGPAVEPPARGGCTEAQLLAATRLPADEEARGPHYACQATRLYDATESLAWWDPRQYVRDVTTRNHTPGHVVRVLWHAFMTDVCERARRRAPFSYRPLEALRLWTHRRLTGREIPEFQGRIARGEPTPTGRLSLRPGERVRVKSKQEIESTLDVTGKNRGLYFDVEMSPYCGRVVTVRNSVTKIIDESTGEVRTMREPCVMLEGVVCKSEYSGCRRMCPREIPSYWREIWLERVDGDSG